MANQLPTMPVEWQDEVHHLPIIGRGVDVPLESKIQIATLLCEMYGTGNYTLESCCKVCGISAATFNNWRKGFKEIKDLYNTAKQNASTAYQELLHDELNTTLLRVIRGEFVREVTRKETVQQMVSGRMETVARRLVVQEQWLKPSTSLLLSLKEAFEPGTYSKQLKLAERLDGAVGDSLENIIAGLEISDDDPRTIKPPITSEEAARQYGKNLNRKK